MVVDRNHDFSTKNLMEDEEDLNQLHQYVIQIFSDCGNSFEKYSPSFLASIALIISRTAEKLLASFSATNNVVGDADPEDLDDKIPRATKLAIAQLLHDDLYKYFMQSIQGFDSSSEPGSYIFQLVLKYFVETEESAKLVAAVSDYILRESFQWASSYSTNQLSDPTLIAIDDVKLILASTKGNQDAEQPSNFNISDIVQRYGQFSWTSLCSVVCKDYELVQLWKRLGMDPTFETTPPFDENSSLQEQEQHLLRVKSVRRKLLFDHGTGGVSADPRFMATSSLPSLADLREFCLTYAPVDPCGRTEDEDGSIDCGVEELLKAIREAKDSKTISIDVFSDTIEGASFLQVYGALTFQVSSGNIGKIECTSSDSVSNFSIMEFLVESFPDVFDATKMVWPTDSIEILNTTLDLVSNDADEAIFRAVWAGKTALFANLPGLKDSVDKYISSDSSGLDDEDTLGQLRPLHIAAYKSSNSCITALIDVLKCDINSKAFDSSNAFFWGMASGCRLDTLELLITRGCDVNSQIYDGPGWQSNMTSFAGFSPLMFAVNVDNVGYVRLLLAAGASTELLTGPLVMRFPLQPRRLLAVHEYQHNGFRFNALHIASVVNSTLSISELLHAGATADARVQPHTSTEVAEQGKYIVDTKHPVEGDFAKELVHLLKTPLHLLPTESTAANLLVQSGASLLAQDFQLQSAGSCHPSVVKEWFESGHGSICTRTALAVCAQKNLDIDCAQRVVEYLVSLHLLDHAERSLRQELSAALWPWMGLSLTHQKLQSEKNDPTLATSWTIHKENIFDALSDYSNNYHLLNDESVIDEKYASAFAFTRDQLRASKFEKGRELLDTIKPSIFTLKYPAKEYPGNEHNQRVKLA